MQKPNRNSQVTTILSEEQSKLNPNVNPIDVNEVSKDWNAKKREREDEEEGDEEDVICPYEPGNPNKKSCRQCSS